VSVIPEQL